jgi:hypothetical protein
MGGHHPSFALDPGGMVTGTRVRFSFNSLTPPALMLPPLYRKEVSENTPHLAFGKYHSREKW